MTILFIFISFELITVFELISCFMYCVRLLCLSAIYCKSKYLYVLIDVYV